MTTIMELRKYRYVGIRCPDRAKDHVCRETFYFSDDDSSVFVMGGIKNMD